MENFAFHGNPWNPRQPMASTDVHGFYGNQLDPLMDSKISWMPWHQWTPSILWKQMEFTGILTLMNINTFLWIPWLSVEFIEVMRSKRRSKENIAHTHGVVWNYMETSWSVNDSLLQATECHQHPPPFPHSYQPIEFREIQWIPE